MIIKAKLAMLTTEKFSIEGTNCIFNTGPWMNNGNNKAGSPTKEMKATANIITEVTIRIVRKYCIIEY